jgi:hypothetical protein
MKNTRAPIQQVAEILPITLMRAPILHPVLAFAVQEFRQTVVSAAHESRDAHAKDRGAEVHP